MKTLLMLVFITVLSCRSIHPLAEARTCQADSPPQKTTVAFQTVDPSGLILVRVRLNGDVICQLMLDTGTTDTCISSSLCERLGLKPKPAANDKGEPIRSPFNPGKTLDRVTLKTLEIGKL